MTGEIDLFTHLTVRTALDAAMFGAVDEPTTQLVVDLSGVTFCGARGLTLLHESATIAAGVGISYALAGLSASLTRLAVLFWPAEHLRYLSVADAITTLRAEQTHHQATLRSTVQGLSE